MNPETVGAWLILPAKLAWLAESAAVVLLTLARLGNVRAAYRRRRGQGGNGGGLTVALIVAGELLAMAGTGALSGAAALIALLSPAALDLRPWPIPAALLAGLSALTAFVAHALRAELRLARRLTRPKGEHAP